MTMLYDGQTVESWVNGLGTFDSLNVRHALVMFALFGLPASYLDVGSGTGAMVNTARKLGIDAYGVDQLPRPDSWLFQRDLRQSLDLGREFQFVSCIEVVEHMPPHAAETLCQTLARHTSPGGILIFTSALPGNGGTGHLTMQPPFWWRGKLYEAGLTFSTLLTLKLALLWSNIDSPMGHLAASLQVFTRGSVRLPSGIEV